MKLSILGLAATIGMTSFMQSQAASAVRFGKACRGGTTNCLDKNWGDAVIQPLSAANRWVLVRVTVPANQTLDVSGFIFRLKATVPDLRIETGIFRANQSTTAPIFSSRIAGSEVYLTSRVSLFAPTWFPQQRFAAQEIFYIGFRSPGNVQPYVSSNPLAADAQWYTATSGGSLNRETNWPWMYRILCNGGTPNITAVTPPRIGTLFHVSVDNTATSAVLMLGASRTSFVGIPLPYDLSGFNLQQCDLNVSADSLYVGTRTSASTWLWTLPIPNAPGLLGGKLYVQWASEVGPGRLRTSEGLDVTIGT